LAILPFCHIEGFHCGGVEAISLLVLRLCVVFECEYAAVLQELFRSPDDIAVVHKGVERFPVEATVLCEGVLLVHVEVAT